MEGSSPVRQCRNSWWTLSPHRSWQPTQAIWATWQAYQWIPKGKHPWSRRIPMSTKPLDSSTHWLTQLQGVINPASSFPTCPELSPIGESDLLRDSHPWNFQGTGTSWSTDRHRPSTLVETSHCPVRQWLHCRLPRQPRASYIICSGMSKSSTRAIS